MLQALSNTIKEFQVVRLATLLKRNPLSGVSEPAVRSSSTKEVFLNNSQNSQENTMLELLFKNTLFYRTSPVAAPESFSFPGCNFIIKETTAKIFFCEFCKICKDIFSFDKTPQDEHLLCLSVNFEFFRTLLL